jgi:hypothetical protein
MAHDGVLQDATAIVRQSPTYRLLLARHGEDLNGPLDTLVGLAFWGIES